MAARCNFGKTATPITSIGTARTKRNAESTGAGVASTRIYCCSRSRCINRTRNVIRRALLTYFALTLRIQQMQDDAQRHARELRLVFDIGADIQQRALTSRYESNSVC